jgi:hypothetical protein
MWVYYKYSYREFFMGYLMALSVLGLYSVRWWINWKGFGSYPSTCLQGLRKAMENCSQPVPQLRFELSISQTDHHAWPYTEL